MLYLLVGTLDYLLGLLLGLVKYLLLELLYLLEFLLVAVCDVLESLVRMFDALELLVKCLSVSGNLAEVSLDTYEFFSGACLCVLDDCLR